MRLTIRPYQEEDREQVLELWDRVFPGDPPHNNPVRDLRTRSEIPPELFLIAVLKEGVVGAVMAGCDEQQGWIYYLGVDPDYRRLGIGSALVKQVEATLITLGCQEVHLQVFAQEAEVSAFYRSLDYTADDSRSMGKKF